MYPLKIHIENLSRRFWLLSSELRSQLSQVSHWISVAELWLLNGSASLVAIFFRYTCKIFKSCFALSGFVRLLERPLSFLESLPPFDELKFWLVFVRLLWTAFESLEVSTDFWRTKVLVDDPESLYDRSLGNAWIRSLFEVLASFKWAQVALIMRSSTDRIARPHNTPKLPESFRQTIEDSTRLPSSRSLSFGIFLVFYLSLPNCRLYLHMPLS